jgi:CheY-like chemotaxis protein
LRTASERNFAQLGGFQSLPRHLAGLRVLVAEDNPTNSRLMQQILRKIGITQLEVVSDGLEVIEHLTSKPVDVILMDCQMPLMDGYETTREIRRLEQADPRRKKAYIIAVTAGAFREDRDRAFEAGMDDFVTKPLRPETLNEALACFLVI